MFYTDKEGGEKRITIFKLFAPESIRKSDNTINSNEKNNEFSPTRMMCTAH